MEGLDNLPVGFRFRPTEDEIINFLEMKMCGLGSDVPMIKDVLDVSVYEPGDLPAQSPMPREDRVWYFFNSLVTITPNSKMIKRKTNSGFWKKTGEDRDIWDKQGKNKIGFKKNLVFHERRAPKGVKSNWVMHEYHSNKAVFYQKEYVLFRLKKKSGVEPDSGNHATENTNPQFLPQRNHDQYHEMLLDNPPSSLLSPVQHILSDSYFLETSEQEDAFMQSSLDDKEEFTAEQVAFVNSLLVNEGEAYGEISVKTLLHGINPTVPLSGVYAGNSTDQDTYHSKVREAADRDLVDLSSETRNSNGKIGNDKQMGQQTRGRTSSKSSSSSNRSGSNDQTKSALILMEAPKLSQETNPPSMFLLNAIVSLVLIIFIIREIMYLH